MSASEALKGNEWEGAVRQTYQHIFVTATWAQACCWRRLKEKQNMDEQVVGQTSQTQARQPEHDSEVKARRLKRKVSKKTEIDIR